MLPSLRRYAEPMTQLRTVNVKLTFNNNGMYPSIMYPLHMFRTLCTIFVKLYSTVHLGETVCRTRDSANRSLKVKVTLRCYGILLRGI